MEHDDGKVTADDIRRALVSTYAQPEWHLCFEVGATTGGGARHADAVAMNCYPSKGFETRGFEIKVSKQDLKHELEQGQKSDAIAKYCDYWFLVCPKGLSDSFTLPPTWGVYEYFDGALRHKTKATKIEKVPMYNGFIASMIRGNQRAHSFAVGDMYAEARKQVEREYAFRTSTAEERLKDIEMKLKEVEEKTGIRLNEYTPSRSIIDRLSAAENLNVIVGEIKAIQRYTRALIESTDEIKQAAAKIGVS